MLSRRGFISGLLAAAAPVVIASSHLMPLRGVKFNPLDPLGRVQWWPVAEKVSGLWSTAQCPPSVIRLARLEMVEAFGVEIEALYEEAGLLHTIGHPNADEILRKVEFDGPPVRIRQRSITQISDAVDQEMDRRTEEMARRPNPFPQRFKRVI
jgi:hypothetical protein